MYKFEKKPRGYILHPLIYCKTATSVSLKGIYCLNISCDGEPTALQGIPSNFVMAPNVEKFFLIMRCLHILEIYLSYVCM